MHFNCLLERKRLAEMPKWTFCFWKATLRPSFCYKCHGDLLPSSTSDSMDSFTRLILCKESVDCDRNFQVCIKLSSFPTLQKTRTQNTVYDIKKAAKCTFKYTEEMHFKYELKTKARIAVMYRNVLLLIVV